MPIGFTITKQDDVYHLVGLLDEHASFGMLLNAPRPLKLNLARLTSVNSLGVRAWLRFVSELGDAEIELHECSLPIVDMLNTFAASLGDPPQPARVSSIHVPYRCPACERDYALILESQDFIRCHHRFPAKNCPRCGHLLDCLSDPSDSLIFLACAD